MASGVPVISSDCDSGPRELLAPATPSGVQAAEPEHGDYGLLMPPLSGLRLPAGAPLEAAERAWADKLSEMLGAPAALRAYAAAGRRRAGEFGLEKTAGLWLGLLGPTT